jgi:hypothetical protein
VERDRERRGVRGVGVRVDRGPRGVLLKFKDGMGEGYDWVESGSFDTGWQVPYYAESVG